MTDHYTTLGVDKNASQEEIKKAEETLRKAKKQDHKINQLNMMSYFQTNLNQTI